MLAILTIIRNGLPDFWQDIQMLVACITFELSMRFKRENPPPKSLLPRDPLLDRERRLPGA